MGKFTKTPATVRTPLRASTSFPTTFTHEGGDAYSPDLRTELFILAAANMVREGTFYESASTRDDRFVGLIHAVAANDPAWLRSFIPYLRTEMWMRSASIVAAAEYVAAKGVGARSLIASTLSRADEPAEILAYWHGVYGRSLPASLKRGVADAVGRLYTERAAVKYDGKDRQWRMGDVIELIHPRPTSPAQSALFKHLVDQRHHGDGELTLDHTTWERENPASAEDWERVIPQMGYMALLRNLRNFDKHGASDEVAGRVAAKLSDPAEVAASRQFPFRFHSAWKATGSMRWGPALEKALELSVGNIPKVSGRTLILVDTSGSMSGRMSDRSTVTRYEVAALFGLALAKACEDATVVSYSSGDQEFILKPGESVLRASERFPFLNGGTYTWSTYQKWAWKEHYDRAVILTDEQAHDSDTGGGVVFTFNLAGYRLMHAAHGVKGRYLFAGLNDAAFKLIPMLDGVSKGRWPWEE